MYHADDTITIIARICSIILFLLSIYILLNHLFKLHDASHQAKSPSNSVRRDSIDTVPTTSALPDTTSTDPGPEDSGNSSTSHAHGYLCAWSISHATNINNHYIVMYSTYSLSYVNIPYVYIFRGTDAKNIDCNGEGLLQTAYNE